MTTPRKPAADRCPTAPADRLAEEQRGTGSDSQRNSLEDDHDVGYRHVKEGDEKEIGAPELADHARRPPGDARATEAVDADPSQRLRYPTKIEAHTPRMKMISPIGRLSLASLISVSLSRNASCDATIAVMPRSVLANGASASSETFVDCLSVAMCLGRRRSDGEGGGQICSSGSRLPLPVEGVEAGRDQHRAAGKSERIRPCVENRDLDE